MKSSTRRIDELVSKYATNTIKYDDLTKDMFKVELEALVLCAKLEQLREDDN